MFYFSYQMGDNAPLLLFLGHPDLVRGEFIFIGGDSMSRADPGIVYDGGFAVTFPTNTFVSFLDFVNSRTPLTSARRNPWFMALWKQEKNCTYSHDQTINDCSTRDHETLEKIESHVYLSSFQDSWNTLFLALDALIRDQCPEVFHDPSTIQDCVDGKDLLHYILKTTFNGTNWQISFDESGDVLGSYEFEQYYSEADVKHKSVALWDKHMNAVKVYEIMLDWSAFVGDGVEYSSDNRNTTVPDSVCSYPCATRQYQQQRELVCCWDCMTCRNNEIINEKRDGCKQCPDLMWPDDDTATYCVYIKPK